MFATDAPRFDYILACETALAKLGELPRRIATDEELVKARSELPFLGMSDERKRDVTTIQKLTAALNRATAKLAGNHRYFRPAAAPAVASSAPTTASYPYLPRRR